MKVSGISMSPRCSRGGGAEHLSRKDRDVQRAKFSWKKGASPLGLVLKDQSSHLSVSCPGALWSQQEESFCRIRWVGLHPSIR